MKKPATQIVLPLIIGLLIIVLGLIGNQYSQTQNLASQELTQDQVYLIDLQVTDPEQFEDAMPTYDIGEILNLENLSLYYDSSLYDYPESNGFDSIRFYFVSEKNSSLEDQRFTNNYATMDLSLADPTILPYLQDQAYCVSDSDCVVKANPCEASPHNKYHQYLDVYGCEGPFGEYDDINDCYRDVTYSAPSCDNNTCVADKSLSDQCQEVPY